jgi:hypothetical protein
MATVRQIERREVLQARCTRAAVFGLWFIGALIGAVIGRIAQPLAAAVPATSAYSQPLNNAGPFYFWRGADMRPMIPPSGAATILWGHEGMVVKEVEPGSPAAQAGLKPGDVVSALDGVPVHSVRALALAIADHCCGPTVRLSVWRDHHGCVTELPGSATSRSQPSVGRTHGVSGQALAPRPPLDASSS